jgi:hypothetical protein
MTSGKKANNRDSKHLKGEEKQTMQEKNPLLARPKYVPF